MSGQIHCRVEDTIGFVTIDRPPVNAFDASMYAELQRVFVGVEEALPGARVIILRGAGRHFCAGNDLDEFATMTHENAGPRMLEVRRAFAAVQDCPVPVIGAVHGAALGTGLAIAAACDFVVASDSARFGLPEVGVGVMGGARHLGRLVPQPVVRWMFFSAESLPAARMAELGALVDVVDDEQLHEAALNRARLIARHSPVVLRVAKHSLNRIEPLGVQEGYAVEQGFTVELAGTPHAREALAAVMQRRPANYEALHDGVPPASSVHGTS